MRKTWLSRNLILLTVVSLTQDAASELLYPLLPILLTTVLGAGIWGGVLWRKSDFELPLVMAGVGALIGVLLLLLRYSAITSSTDETRRSIS